ncbi:hypothetical protein D3C84_1128460 [compost metagenome]
MAFRQLQIVLGLGRLIAGGNLAIGPISLFQSPPNALHFFFFEQAWNVQQHGKTPDNKRMAMVLILIAYVKPARRTKQQKP